MVGGLLVGRSVVGGFNKTPLKMAQGLEEINCKISTQFELRIELAEKETERVTTRNKKNEIEKHLQHVELKLEKSQEFKYSALEVLLEEGEMGNLEEWSSVMEEKMARFDDVVDRLKGAISNVEKKEEAKAKHEENIIQGEIFRRKREDSRDRVTGKVYRV